MADNKLSDLKKFFSTPEEPLTLAEFKDEWNALSEEEKQWFREQKLN